MKTFLLFAFIALAACQKQPIISYSMSRSDVIEHSKTLRGSIYSSTNDTGPFRFYATSSVPPIPPGGTIEVGVDTKSGKHSISIPKKDGFFYEADSYENSNGGILFVLREVPISRKSTEQDAAANP